MLHTRAWLISHELRRSHAVAAFDLKLKGTEARYRKGAPMNIRRWAGLGAIAAYAVLAVGYREEIAGPTREMGTPRRGVRTGPS